MPRGRGPGAPYGNKNAKGRSSRGRSVAVGALGGAVGIGAHAGYNSRKGKDVHSGYHGLGSGITGAIGGGLAAGPAGAAIGAVAGGAMGYGISKLGKKIGAPRSKRRKK